MMVGLFPFFARCRFVVTTQTEVLAKLNITSDDEEYYETRTRRGKNSPLGHFFVCLLYCCSCGW